MTALAVGYLLGAVCTLALALAWFGERAPR